MCRSAVSLLCACATAAAAAAAVGAVVAAPAPRQKSSETFLVENSGLAFLGPDGREKERLEPYATCGALSPDGRLVACLEYEHARGQSRLVIRPRGEKGAALAVPGVSVAVGEGFLPVWSADGRRLLLGHDRAGQEYSHRVYDLATRKLTVLKLPAGHWVTGWSGDGKRLLTTARGAAGGPPRVAWVRADGTGGPDFITREGGSAAHGSLSPDGRRVLYLGRPKPGGGSADQARLYVMDLATKDRVAVDAPGQTHGYCWSPDGSRVAYTWQRALGQGEVAAERETFLVTCDPDGRNQKKVTSRRYRPARPTSGAVIFFRVLAWR